jgi:hypothetical protein
LSDGIIFRLFPEERRFGRRDFRVREGGSNLLLPQTLIFGIWGRREGVLICLLSQWGVYYSY